MSESKNHSEQFERYLKGTMTPDEAHAFEREHMDDPFTQEALEGFEIVGSDSLSDIEKLREQIISKRERTLTWLKLASAAAIILIGSFFVYNTFNDLENYQRLTSNDNTTDEVVTGTPSPDTILTEIKEANEVDRRTGDQITQKEEEEITQKEKEGDKNEHIAANLATKRPDETEADIEREDATTPVEEIEPLEITSQDAILSIANVEIDEELPAASDFTENTDIADALQGQAAGVKIEEARAKKAEFSAATARSVPISSTEITGTVIDETGEPLPGVNVVIKGTTFGTQTDLDGNYSIEKTDNMTLVYSFIGFKSQEVQVGSQSVIDVTMGGTMELQEVVVTGYGARDNAIESYSGAQPQAGTRAYKEYLEENLQYPEAAIQNNVEGTVILGLIISPSGSIDNIDIKRSIGYGCDEEAIRLVREGPKWIPAERNGVNVTDEVRVKVKFNR